MAGCFGYCCLWVNCGGVSLGCCGYVFLKWFLIGFAGCWLIVLVFRGSLIVLIFICYL